MFFFNFRFTPPFLEKDDGDLAIHWLLLQLGWPMLDWAGAGWSSQESEGHLLKKKYSALSPQKLFWLSKYMYRRPPRKILAPLGLVRHSSVECYFASRFPLLKVALGAMIEVFPWASWRSKMVPKLLQSQFIPRFWKSGVATKIFFLDPWRTDMFLRWRFSRFCLIGALFRAFFTTKAHQISRYWTFIQGVPKKVGFTATITSSKSNFFWGHLVLYLTPR